MKSVRGSGGDLLRLTAVVAFSIASYGCTALVNGLAKHAATRSSSEHLRYYAELAPRVGSCIGERGGACPADDVDVAFQAVAPLDTKTAKREVSVAEGASSGTAREQAADAARRVLNHSVQRQLNELYNIARGAEVAVADGGGNAAGATPRIEIDADEFENYMNELETATLLDGWTGLADEIAVAGSDCGSDDVRRKLFLKAYFAAYFRNGHFFRATLDFSARMAALEAKIKQSMPGLSPEDYKKIVDGLAKNLGMSEDSAYVFGSVADVGFVTRGGQKLQFPALEASIAFGGNPELSRPKVDFELVGADLIRVLLHAIYDAHDGLPGISGATGTTLAPPGCALADNAITSALPPEEFGQVEAWSNRVEGVTTAGVGRLIRGMNFFSLNNEALATAIETAVGTAARKYAEKVAWCVYQCKEGMGASPVSDDAQLKEVEILVTRVAH